MGNRHLPAGAALAVLLASASLAEGPPQEKKPDPRTIELKTSDGLVLAADLYEPAGGGETRPAVLALHHEGGNRAVWKAVGELLTDHGMTLLALDLRGHGGSRMQGEEDLGPRAEARDEELWKAMEEDVRAGLKFLRGTLLADGKRLGILGLSAGMALALQGAEKDDGVRAVFGIAPAPAGCGVPGTASAVRWDDRPIGYLVGEKDTGGGVAPLDRALRKKSRVDTVVLPLEETTAPEALLLLERTVAEAVQFFLGWFYRPVLTGKPEDGVRRGGGIFVSGSGSSSGTEAGGIKFGGYMAPGNVQGVMVLSEPDSEASRWTENTRRVTLVPGKGKEPGLSALVERWTGRSWKKDRMITLYDCGAFVTEEKTTFYEVWIPPSLLGVPPFSKVNVTLTPIVDGRPKWADKSGGFGAAKKFRESDPSSWQEWELR